MYKGFTLIEVLVATVILIISISAITLIYRGAYLSSDKANNHIVIKTALPSILANIKLEIRGKSNGNETELSGKGKSWETEYSWQAQLEEFKAAPTRLDVDTGQFVTPPKKYKLWQVTLFLKTNKMQKQYQYKELGWNNA
ncbi:hypothetical protein GCM10025767_30180 [Thalassotalea piscium]